MRFRRSDACAVIPGEPDARGRRALPDPQARRAITLVAAVFLGAAAFVWLSLSRPEPATFAPTPPVPAEVGERLVGPIIYTIDAAAADRWHFFDFSRGAAVEPGPLDWDLAFRRFHIIANGGEGFAGNAGIAALDGVAFDSVRVVPESGYATTVAGRDSINAAIDRWYDYSFTTHLLTPKPRLYAVRTADGRFAKLELLSYYCPGARPGCVTFRYVYQGDGSRRVR
ncbi:MAG: HmuY family protein [Gemmatimonadetes bacterium]|nr:HmuY family protein [Gemmatimonadota bacterium]